MKKILLFALAAALTLSLSACGDLAAYELYTKMNEKQKDLTSLEMNTNAVIHMETGGQDVEITMNGVTKQVIRSETDIDMEMKMNMSFMGQEMSTSSYYVDGTMYQDVMGQKIKMKLNLDEAVQAANSAMLSFGEDAIKSSSVTKVDGGSMLSFELDPTFLEDTLSAMTNSITQGLGAGTDMKMTFTQMKYDMLIDKDYMMKNATMDFTVEMEIQGEVTTMQYTINLDIVGVNSIAAITFPADLDEYTET